MKAFLTCRLPLELMTLLRKTAKEEGCTVTSIVINAIRSYL
jgi:hypothetical protein